MSKSKNLTKSFVCYLLALSGLFLMAGCATETAVYQANFNTVKHPQMSYSEALENFRREFLNQSGQFPGFQVTNTGFSFNNNGIVNCKFADVKNLSVTQDGLTGKYWIKWSPDLNLGEWSSLSDAQGFVDAVMAIKYYGLSRYLSDDATAFADFQEKANIWRALPQKPSLPEEVHRFIVLKDDAIQNNEFDKAADYYEQALAIDPMWPAGQYNVALIYEQLKVYPMAIMHMKRYLALEPDAKNARADQDKIYLWEEKAKEGDASSDNSNAQPAQAQTGLFGQATGYGGNP